MFYSLTLPESETDRVHLYSSVEDAIAQARDERQVYAVAVDFDPRCGLVLPSWVDSACPDPVWTSRAERNGDGSIVVEGTIPRKRFVAWLWM
jgi:hypothetical protein